MFIPGTACVFSGSGGFRCRQVYVKEYGIAGGAEWPPGPAFSRQGSPSPVPGAFGGGRGDARA